MTFFICALIFLLLAIAAEGAVCAVLLYRLSAKADAFGQAAGNGSRAFCAHGRNRAPGRLKELAENWRARKAAKEIESSESV